MARSAPVALDDFALLLYPMTLGLCVNPAQDAGFVLSPVGEPVGNGYAPVALPTSLWTVTVTEDEYAGGALCIATNTDPIVFPTVTGSWGVDPLQWLIFRRASDDAVISIERLNLPVSPDPATANQLTIPAGYLTTQLA